jgi:hypothetical protein
VQEEPSSRQNAQQQFEEQWQAVPETQTTSFLKLVNWSIFGPGVNLIK